MRFQLPVAAIKKCARMMGTEINRKETLAVPLTTKCCTDVSTFQNENPFLFERPTELDGSVKLAHYKSLADLAQSEDARSYFKSSQNAGKWALTDNHPRSQYYCHQLRFFHLFKEAFPEGLADLSLLDVAGSCGYYALHGKKMGMRETKVIEARESPRDIFRVLHKTLGLDDSCSFEKVDVEYGMDSYKQTHDIVLALGIMYHVFDHHRFIRNIYRMTDRMAVIATRVTGRDDSFLHMKFEDSSKPRASLHGPSLVPSVNSLASMLDYVGFRKLKLVTLPEPISSRFTNYHNGTRAMIAAYK